MQIDAQAQAILTQVTVRRVTVEEESRFSELLTQHHYLGALPNSPPASPTAQRKRKRPNNC